MQRYPLIVVQITDIIFSKCSEKILYEERNRPDSPSGLSLDFQQRPVAELLGVLQNIKKI